MTRTSIAIFGASVTQQKDGYAPRLRQQFSEAVHVFGYGGMHLHNAGICFIDRVLARQPAYCFVDWFSTGYLDTSERTTECIETIIYRFSRAGCKLVFLFLPRADARHAERIEFERLCKEYLQRRAVSYIDLNDEIGDLAGILRDPVHTTEYGSKKYAEVIHARFMDMKASIAVPSCVNPTRYVSIKKLQINRSFNNTLEIEGRAELVGLLLTVGPHSGLVEVIDGDKVTRVNTWDKWCHYERLTFGIPYRVDGGIVLKVLQDRFDTSTTRQPYDYDSIGKELVVHDMYYCDGSLKLVGASTGRRLDDRRFPRKTLRGMKTELGNFRVKLLEKRRVAGEGEEEGD